jgi:hypothetical protein
LPESEVVTSTGVPEPALPQRARSRGRPLPAHRRAGACPRPDPGNAASNQLRGHSTDHADHPSDHHRAAAPLRRVRLQPPRAPPLDTRDAPALPARRRATGVQEPTTQFPRGHLPIATIGASRNGR